MAGSACKIIINNLTAAVSASLETVLVDPQVRELITPEKADALLQELVDMDLHHFAGSPAPSSSQRGLQGIVAELVECGVFTEEVWAILRPAAPERLARRHPAAGIGAGEASPNAGPETA